MTTQGVTATTSQGVNMSSMVMQVPGQSQQTMGQVGPSGIAPNIALQNINQRPVAHVNAHMIQNKIPGMNMMQNQQMQTQQFHNQQIQNQQIQNQQLQTQQIHNQPIHHQQLQTQQVPNQQIQNQQIQSQPIQNQQLQNRQIQSQQIQKHQLQNHQLQNQQIQNQHIQNQQMVINQMEQTQNIQGLNRGPQQYQINIPQQMTGAQHRQINVQQQSTGARMGLQQPQISQAQQIAGLQQQYISQQQQMTGPQVSPNQMQQSLQNQMHSQMTHQMGSSISPGMQQPQPPRPHLQQQQFINQMHVNQATQQQMGHSQPKPPEFVNPACTGQKNITPTKFLQSPASSIPSPSSLPAPGSCQMVPSPMVVSPNSQHATPGGHRNTGMVPSPSCSLNTPSGMLSGPAPSPMQDDQVSQACKEKILKLRKYIDPLQKMILKFTAEGYTEKMSKMKKLLEILTNPSANPNLEVLQKCEVVLEKMDFKKFEGIGTTATTPVVKENKFSNPLLEVVSNLLHSSTANHTLQRTFGPCVDALLGPGLRNMPPALPPQRKRKREEYPDDIPDILQGEIARLDQRFKISQDPTQLMGSNTIDLICWLDDKNLPCLPSILVTVPLDYPANSPKCHIIESDYATPFLTVVKNALITRLDKLPKKHSLSQLLDAWEMSVRQAADPKNQNYGNAPKISAVQSKADSTTNSISEINARSIRSQPTPEMLKMNLINKLLSS